MSKKGWIVLGMIFVVVFFGVLLYYKDVVLPHTVETRSYFGDRVAVGMKAVGENNTLGEGGVLVPKEENCSSDVIKPSCLGANKVVFKEADMCQPAVLLCDAMSFCFTDNVSGLADCQIWEDWDKNITVESVVDSCVNGSCPDRCDAILNFKTDGECLKSINKCLYHQVFLHSSYPSICPVTPDASIPEPNLSGLPAVTGAGFLVAGTEKSGNGGIVFMALLILGILSVAYFRADKRGR